MIARLLQRFGRDVKGAAAAEFTLVAVLLAYVLINVGDLGVYVYDKMQVESAAQASVESLWAQCAPATNGAPDVTDNCSNVASIVTKGAQQTSLGTNVSASIASSPGEGWYCSSKNASATLTRLTTSIKSSQPTCTSIVSTDTSNAGDYVPITATYTFTPIFPGATVSSLLPSTIAQTVWIRVV